MKRILSIILICLTFCGCRQTDNELSSYSSISVFSTSTSTSVGTTATAISTTVPTSLPATSSTTSRSTTKPTKRPSTQTTTTTEPIQPPLTLDSYLHSMTREQKVGQLFLARCPEKNAVLDIQKYHLGGYILFNRDFKNDTPKSITKTISSYQSAASTPLFIAVDEEGGTVTRVSCYPAYRDTPFLSPRELYEAGGLVAIRQNEVEKSQLLSSLGINVNLSPVCDIATDENAFMYPRSLGQSPEITGEFVKTALNAMSQNGITGVLKHFPGYGNNADTHVGIAVDNRTLAQLESYDLLPFQTAIDAGCPAIMISHVYINALDADLPATLSPSVNRYLRQTMGFDGIIVTDDLVMQAITDEYGTEEAAILAVLAGNDLLISTQYAVQYEAVLNAVKSGRISQEQLDASVRRILQWKIDMGILKIK